MPDLEQAIAKVFARNTPDCAGLIRKLRAKGASKSDVIRTVTKSAAGSTLMRSGLLLLVDEIWKESDQ
jgi:hypothetical protein